MKRIYSSPYFLWGILLAVVALTILSACQTPSSVKEAQTLDQKAFATYGTFVVFEEQAAQLAKDPATPAAVKTALAQADNAAKPFADHLLDAVKVYENVSAQLAAGTTTAEKLSIATADLQSWLNEATPVVTSLVTAVKGAKK